VGNYRRDEVQKIESPLFKKIQTFCNFDQKIDSPIFQKLEKAQGILRGGRLGVRLRWVKLARKP